MPGERRRAAVLGHPVAHSLSPVLHRAAYRELGLDWEYERLDVTEAALPALLDGLDASWAGLSLTMPLKTSVLAYLDVRSPLVEITGAANTVVLAEGSRAGHNTDVVGIVRALEEIGVDRVERATVLGAGATARSALAALARLGVARAVAVARRPEAATGLDATAAALGVHLAVVPWGEAAAHLRAPVVVSTVPAGAADDLAGWVPESPGSLLDVVYEPWPTPLARRWLEAGGRVTSGVTMLLHQAVAQVELMTGRTPAVEPMRAALLEAARAR